MFFHMLFSFFFLNFRYDFLMFCKNFFEFHYDSVKEFYIVFEAGNVRTLRLVHLHPPKRLSEKAAVYFR